MVTVHRERNTAASRIAAARDAQAAVLRRFTAASESIRDTLDEADQTVDVLETIARRTPGVPSEVLTKLLIARRFGPGLSRRRRRRRGA